MVIAQQTHSMFVKSNSFLPRKNLITSKHKLKKNRSKVPIKNNSYAQYSENLDILFEVQKHISKQQLQFLRGKTKKKDILHEQIVWTVEQAATEAFFDFWGSLTYLQWQKKPQAKQSRKLFMVLFVSVS